MGEFASKGVAGAGLGLGIAGTALGVLNSNGNGNGILGGLFGGNNNQVAALFAENAMLKSENYSDKVAKETYQQTLVDRATLKAELKELMDLREQLVLSKIDSVATLANQGLQQVNGQIACLAKTVDGITRTVVPASAVCPAPMPLYNSWKDPTSSTTTTPSTGA